MTIKDLLKVYNGIYLIRQNDSTIYKGLSVPAELLGMEVVSIKPTSVAGDGMMWVFI